MLPLDNLNSENVTCTHPNATRPCSTGRNDELGHFVMKYSDDEGRSWSHKRFEVPYRLTEIDRQNTWGGQVKVMWNVDQVKTMEDGKTAIVGFTKIGTCASPFALGRLCASAASLIPKALLRADVQNAPRKLAILSRSVALSVSLTLTASLLQRSCSSSSRPTCSPRARPRRSNGS